MAKIIKHFWLISLILAVVVSILVIKKSLFMRWFGYENIPVPITDEFDYAWQGISLSRYGIPMGWTTLTGVYSDARLQPIKGTLDGFGISVDGKIVDRNKFLQDRQPLNAVAEIDYMKGPEHMSFVVPFFDHAPLGGLIYSLGVDKKVSRVDEVKPSAFRQPALIMGVITAVLIFVLLWLVTANPWIGTLGVIVYSTVPTYLLATRMAFLENAVSPFILFHLILLVLLTRAAKNVPEGKIAMFLAVASGLIGGMAILAKETAIGFLIGSLILLVMHKLNRKLILLFLISAAAPVIVYFGWGIWLQKELFLNIFTTNTNREYFGALKLVSMMEALKFKNFPVDGWWIWGFISLLLISIKVRQKNILFVTIPLVTHLLTIWMIGSNNSPWYLISSIPLLAACSAIFIGQIFTEPTIATALAFFLVPFSSSYYWGRIALNLAPSINHYRYAFLIFGAILGIRLIFKNQKVFHWLWILFLAILINKIVTFNEVFLPYLIAHWGSMPIPSLPNF